MTKRMYVRIVATLVILLVAVSLYSSTNTMTRYHPNPMTKADASNRTMITTIHNNDNSDNDDSNNNTTTTTVATNINTMTTIHNKYKLINVGLVSSGTSSFARVTTKLLGLRSAHTLTPWTRHALQQEGWGVLSETNLTLTTSPSRSSSSSRRRRRNTTLLVTELEQYDAFGDIPFMAPYIIAQAGQSVRQHAIVAGSRSSRSRRSGVGNRNETTATTTSSMTRTTFIFIATNRTKASWVTSMLKRPNKGGVAFRVFYELPTCTEDKEDNEDDQNPRVVNHGGCMMKTLEPITADQWGTVYDGHQQLLREYGIPTLDLEATTARKWTVLCDTVAQVARDWKTMTTSTTGMSTHTPGTVYTVCDTHRRNGTPWPTANNTTKNKKGRKKNMKEKKTDERSREKERRRRR